MSGRSNVTLVCCITIAGCAQQTVSPPVPTYSQTATANRSAELQTLKPGYSVLYRFAGNADGAYPLAGLVTMEGQPGVFYGTTEYGGSSAICTSGVTGCGTVFTLTRSRTGYTERVLYNFKGGADGALPTSELLAMNGMLYGTTESGGGSKNFGTVFALTTSGVETILHRFQGPDGALPRAGLTQLHGVLYGTTYYGGANEAGTVFSLTPSASGDNEKVLYSFKGGFDGAAPEAKLVAANGVLYGTTLLGGVPPTKTCVIGGSDGCGTVFEVTTSGLETVLYRFRGGADGDEPFAALLLFNGGFYGTTAYGGPANAGTAFELEGSTEHVLHAFSGAADGAEPQGALVRKGNLLYGTTAFGGTGAGTIFAMSRAGLFNTLHAFGGGNGGFLPTAPLLRVGNVLYGTTYAGGTTCNCGTVFSFI